MNNLSAAKLMASAPELHSLLLLAQFILVVMYQWNRKAVEATLAETDTAIRSRYTEGAASTVLSAQ